MLAPGAQAAAPPKLSADSGRVAVDSTYGAGDFGSWGADAFGLPFYRHAVDEQTFAGPAQPEISGRTDAWHQVGNDHVIANAYNHG